MLFSKNKDGTPRESSLNYILKQYIMTTKKTTSKPGTTTHRRDAGTGLYITKKYADKHPKTTVKETDKNKK